ncbi:MAG TPA: AAA family ATPase [Actinocrinis sp.]|nr:AAA family ATPase [Actinocrinis sp.]
MDLIEREEALATLARLCDEAAAGHGSAVVVAGAAAVGKTALLDRAAARALGAGALVLTATASAAEHGLPMAVLAQFLLGAQVPRDARERLADLISAGGPAPQAAPGEPLSGLDVRLAERLCAEFAGLAGKRAVVLVVDDAHHADDASAAYLAYLVRRIRDARIMVLLGHRASSRPAARDLRLDVLRQPHGHDVALRPLSEAGAARFAAARLGPDAEQAAAECFALTGGNPLLLQAVVEDFAAADGCEPPAAGEHYAAAVLSCVRRSAPIAMRAARAVAVLGSGPVDRLLALDPPSAQAAVRELEAAGLLRDGRFRHPCARTAVLADLEPDDREDLYLRAAELGHADGLPAEIVAERLYAARRAPAPWAVPVLEEAARQALAEGRVAIAIEYLRFACELCVDQARRAKLETTLVRAEWRVNPNVPAHRLADLLEAVHAGHLGGSDTVVLAKALLWHGRFAEAAEALTTLDASSEKAGPETAAELRATRPWLRSSYAPLMEFIPAAADHPEAARDASATETRRRIDAANALDCVLTDGPSQWAVGEAERILRATRLETMGMDTAESALLALVYAEHPHRAAPWCDALIDGARTREAPGRRARLRAIRSEIAVRLGDLPGAERHAAEALEIMPASGWGVCLGSCLGSLITALTAMGRQDEAARTVNLPVPAAMLQSRFGLHYLRARGRWQLATGDLDGARADFEHCGELMRRWELDVPGLIPWRTDVAETLLARGERGPARRLLEDQLSRCEEKSSPRTWGSATRLFAAAAEPRHRPALLHQATNALQASGDRYLLAVALADLTAAYRELGQPHRARVVGRRAWAIAVECGAEPLSRALAAHAGPAESEPTTTLAALSDAERRVVDLVAVGHTNREIARRLYVTPSTVEQHLTHAYRKLNVSCRADLVVALCARPEADTASR